MLRFSTSETARDLELFESAAKMRLMRAHEKKCDHLLTQTGNLDSIRIVRRFDGARCHRIVARVLAALQLPSEQGERSARLQLGEFVVVSLANRVSF